ncbi:pyridoxal-phosphate dependent enzyme [Oricola cellulosilytica]|uniref:Pyridoxal-phosphate dependent enzyme n=1 Tax=Oricola cellulosilytica TaxID=1429082 RepID=A0A4R0PG64_9HYPH|nr:pyridoxal-phosphate dependent enzyme [Oricola cellulosilytica]TCD14464.1 pyridoxal-phosphate dependent enzyme [Oricola cellulosilytica]
MTDFLLNPHRGCGLATLREWDRKPVSNDNAAARRLFARCPAAHATPLISMDVLARDLGVAGLSVKDERGRMGLGSFKALGAAYAIAKLAFDKNGGSVENIENALKGVTFVCASAGNHGLSVAAGARLFGASAVVFLAETVPEGFADRLREKGARVVREGAGYEAGMAAAQAFAEKQEGYLLSDSSWPDYVDPARDVMEGYLVMAAEAGEQIAQPPTHVFLQAGVGGLAAACTVAARALWGDAPKIVVVEPDRAAALLESIRACKPVRARGPESNMGRLDCKEPSHLALACLAREADAFMTVSDDAACETVALLARHGLVTSPSGAGGLAGLHHMGEADAIGLDERSHVLAYVTEGAEG